jgi:hypothetical protein
MCRPVHVHDYAKATEIKATFEFVADGSYFIRRANV